MKNNIEATKKKLSQKTLLEVKKELEELVKKEKEIDTVFQPSLQAMSRPFSK